MALAPKIGNDSCTSPSRKLLASSGILGPSLRRSRTPGWFISYRRQKAGTEDAEEVAAAHLQRVFAWLQRPMKVPVGDGLGRTSVQGDDIGIQIRRSTIDFQLECLLHWPRPQIDHARRPFDLGAVGGGNKGPRGVGPMRVRPAP